MNLLVDEAPAGGIFHEPEANNRVSFQFSLDVRNFNFVPNLFNALIM